MIEEEEVVRDIERGARLNGAAWMAVGVILAALTVAVGFSVWSADHAEQEIEDHRLEAKARDVRITSLEKALAAQREQFNACKGKNANAPGCQTPIAPKPEDVEPDIIQGPEGPVGLQGPQGPQGPRGPRGFIGPIGPRGVPGEDGADGDQGPAGVKGDAGSAGPQGEAGVAGKDGAAGPRGEKGDKGEPGAQGPAGPAGPAGQDAPRIVDVYFGTDPSACVLVVALSDGTSYAASAPPVFCAIN